MNFDPNDLDALTTDNAGMGPGPVGVVATPPVGIQDRFVSTLRDGGLTNPFGLGAVAAYAAHESGYSPQNINGSWSDPSQSGQPGTSGGILSWRGDRLNAMRDFTAGATDPVAAQAKFLLAENPALTRALQGAGSPQEANSLMANAWRFAGYNQPGGENAARLATTTDFANRLANGQALPASAPRGGASMGSTAQQGGFGLGGIVAQGAPVPGQASANPGLPTFSGQPGMQVQPQAASPYGGITDALKSAQAAQQGRGQGRDQGGGMQFAPMRRPQPVSITQARQMFDPSQFFNMVNNAIGRR